MAVGFAPFAEEYLFRGLLFRALDREWGGWRAVVGSAAFFAIYHPAISWLPVGLLGAANASCSRKRESLRPRYSCTWSTTPLSSHEASLIERVHRPGAE